MLLILYLSLYVVWPSAYHDHFLNYNNILLLCTELVLLSWDKVLCNIASCRVANSDYIKMERRNVLTVL